MDIPSPLSNDEVSWILKLNKYNFSVSCLFLKSTFRYIPKRKRSFFAVDKSLVNYNILFTEKIYIGI